MKLTRNFFVPMLDVSGGQGDPDYKPVDLSTIFEMSWNPQEETFAYIKDANDSTVVNGYQIELPQEIVLESTNPIYNFVKNLFFSFGVGSALNVPVLVAIPGDNPTGKTPADIATDGYLWSDAVLSPTALNTVDGKLTFSLKLNGDATHGTVTGAGTDQVTFTAEDESE